MGNVAKGRLQLHAWMTAICLFIGTALVFSPSLAFGFVTYDDPVMLIDNPWFRGFGWRNLNWMWTTFHTGPYQPLSWMSLALDYVLWRSTDTEELNAFGFHLTNVLLHSLNTVLAFFLSLRILEYRATNRSFVHCEPGQADRVDSSFTDPMTNIISSDCQNSDLFGAATAALFFGVHPLRVEVVAWITERRELLATLFLLCFLVAYVDYARCTGRKWSKKSLGAYGLSFGFFFLSLLAKAMGMTWPVALLVLDVYPLQRLPAAPWKWGESSQALSVLCEKIPFIVVAIPVAVVAALGQAKSGAMTPWSQHPLSARLTQYGYALIWYPQCEVLPFGLCPLYAINPPVLPFSARFFPSLVLVVFVTSALILLRRRWPAGLAAWMLFFVLISPVSGLAQSGQQLVADRYTYVPCIPFAMLIGSGCQWLWNWSGGRPGHGRPTRMPRVAMIAAVASILSVFAALSVVQLRIWSSSISLWEQVVRISPSPQAELNLGYLLLQEGREAEAERRLAKAAIAPSVFEDVACYFLGNLCRDQGRLDDSLQFYERARRISPGYSDASCQIARIHAARGESARAREGFVAILHCSPGFAEAWIGLGDLAADEGNRREALRFYLRARQERPDSSMAHERLALELRDARQFDEALQHLRSARSLAKQPIAGDDKLRQELDQLTRPKLIDLQGKSR